MEQFEQEDGANVAQACDFAFRMSLAVRLRFAPGGASTEAVEGRTLAALGHAQEAGDAFVSHAPVDGRPVCVAITNHRTCFDAFQVLLTRLWDADTCCGECDPRVRHIEVGDNGSGPERWLEVSVLGALSGGSQRRGTQLDLARRPSVPHGWEHADKPQHRARVLGPHGAGWAGHATL